MKTIPKTVILKDLNARGLQTIVRKINSISKSGGSVNVATTNLFASEYSVLQSVLDTYTSGSFDGMQDMYVYDNKPKKEFSVKYLFIRNTWTPDFEDKAKLILKEKYGVTNDETSQTAFRSWFDVSLRKVLNHLDNLEAV